jgi:type II secretory pathway component PulM
MPLERRAKALLDEHVEALSPEVSRRLARARAASLAEVSRSRGSWVSSRWLTLPRSTQWVAMASGLAAVSAVLVILRSSPLLERMPATQGLRADDVELVATMNTEGDDIEMLQDLEFYSWLTAEPAVENGGLDETIG